MNLILRPIFFFKDKNCLKVQDFIGSALPKYCSLCIDSFSTSSKKVVQVENQETEYPADVSGSERFEEDVGVPDDFRSNNTNKKFSHNSQKTVDYILKKYPRKVKDLSKSLNLPMKEAAALFQKYGFLINRKMSTISPKINFLLEQGISTEQLLKDLWILTYTIETMEKRIQLLNELHLKPIKPWLLRTSEHMLYRMSMNRENNRLAMGSAETVSDYLKKRLNISDSQLRLFSSRYPPVMRVKVAKLKEIIDFLQAEGFTSYQIYATPRILCHSLLTIQARLTALRTRNYELHSLSVLCRSNRHFKKILDASAEKETKT